MSAVRLARSITEVPRSDWEALDHGASPFLRHGFLRALEETGSIGERAGWVPLYILLEEAGELIAGMAAFVKDHSYGEFIFDWEWARASERAGIPYYPKLVIAAPMTPATGPRLLLARGLDAAGRRVAGEGLVRTARQLAMDLGCSGVHFLFVTREERDLLAELGVKPRASFQFHWHNRGETDFEGFLARMSSRRRKQARKERERARAAVDAIDWLEGAAIGAGDLAAMERFYRSNVDAHWGTAYLEPGFFARLVAYMPEHVVMARALRGGRPVAGALFLETERALYGRYWGADESIPNLHFEMTVWGPIDRAIRRGQAIYEAGAQGGHKLLRGLEPSATHSCHQLFHPALAGAVEYFLEREAEGVTRHMTRLAGAGPFKDDG